MILNVYITTGTKIDNNLQCCTKSDIIQQNFCLFSSDAEDIRREKPLLLSRYYLEDIWQYFS